MISNHTLTLTIVTFLALTSLAGCIDLDDSGTGDLVTQDFHREYEADENTTLTVENRNGNIKVTTWSGDSIKLHAQKKVKEKYEEELNDVIISSVRTNDVFLIEAVYTKDPPHHVSVEMTLNVPANVTVGRLETANGNIELTGTLGNVSLNTTNGNIWAGEIQGYVVAGTSNGNINIGESFGIGNVSTSNGNIDVMVRDAVGDISIHTRNGGITARLTASLDANLSMTTVNGKVTIHDLNVNLTRDETENKEGTLGNGDHRIDIATSNGNVDVYELK